MTIRRALLTSVVLGWACWGSGGYGKASPPAGRFVAVEAGTDHSCGVRPTGVTVCWGRNQAGQTSVPPSFNDFG